MTEPLIPPAPDGWAHGVLHIDDSVFAVGQFSMFTRWNGWACPRFTREQGKLVMDQLMHPAEHASFAAWRLIDISPIRERLDATRAYSPEHREDCWAEARRLWAEARRLMDSAPDGDTFIAQDNPAMTDPFVEYWEPDEDGLYDLGSHAWCWSVDSEAWEVYERLLREIVEDVLSGIHPLDVSDFSTLHDRVDANTYAGWCDGDDSVAASMSHQEVNALQNAADEWLKAGHLRRYITGNNLMVWSYQAHHRPAAHDGKRHCFVCHTDLPSNHPSDDPCDG